MKKIIFITVIIIFIPFLIVNFYKIDEKEEIKIRYMSNTIIRVKRMSTGNIDSIPFEEYIVGVLAGEMPIYFDKFKLLNKLTFSLFKIYLNANNMYLLSSFIKLIFSCFFHNFF